MPEGRLDLAALPQLLGLRPRLVALAHMSNMLGTINPVAEITQQAHQAGALVLIDAAQSVPHMAVDVGQLGADFLAFSAHKMCGPTGIGVLFAREELLEAMPPFLGGGDMIKRVELRSFVANDVPYKFEAGTPAIAEAIGLEAAIHFLDRVGLDSVHAHEQQLAAHAIDRLEEVPGVKVYGPPAEERGGVVAFTLEGIHPHDIAQLLDSEGVAVRAGHHCAMPVHQKFGIPASTRASFYLYNTLGEVDRLVEGLYAVKQRFA
jgi:cysteine desulfurase/selenocysteine lyase